MHQDHSPNTRHAALALAVLSFVPNLRAQNPETSAESSDPTVTERSISLDASCTLRELVLVREGSIAATVVTPSSGLRDPGEQRVQLFLGSEKDATSNMASGGIANATGQPVFQLAALGEIEASTAPDQNYPLQVAAEISKVLRGSEATLVVSAYGEGVAVLSSALSHLRSGEYAYLSEAQWCNLAKQRLEVTILGECREELCIPGVIQFRHNEVMDDLRTAIAKASEQRVRAAMDLNADTIDSLTESQGLRTIARRVAIHNLRAIQATESNPAESEVLPQPLLAFPNETDQFLENLTAGVTLGNLTTLQQFIATKPQTSVLGGIGMSEQLNEMVKARVAEKTYLHTEVIVPWHELPGQIDLAEFVEFAFHERLRAEEEAYRVLGG